MGDDLAYRLVIRDNAGSWGINPKPHGFAVDFDLVSKLDSLANVGRLVVDRNSSLQNELLHLQTRPHARLRQNFMQLGGLGHGQKDSLGGRVLSKLCVSICIKSA